MTSRVIFNAYIELLKTRIMMLVLITAALGYFLGAKEQFSWITLIFFMLGVSLSCGGAGALNHYMERDVDARMHRTKNRPIPSGMIEPQDALIYGLSLVLVGVFVLIWKVNVLTAFLSLLSAFLYVLVYTPLKRITWLNTSIGAIPGALPPMGGWAAATGELSLGAWVLFAILFIWQHPHFYSIAWMLKDEYRKAGFKMLPVVDPSGTSTFGQIIIFSILLLPISLLPCTIGLSGPIYFYGALMIGAALLFVSLMLSQSRSLTDAKYLLKATVLYLPVLFILIVVDVSIPH
jgi:protoheme IX farnesyltransferase